MCPGRKHTIRPATLGVDRKPSGRFFVHGDAADRSILTLFFVLFLEKYFFSHSPYRSLLCIAVLAGGRNLAS
jgi:hypothetical protein